MKYLLTETHKLVSVLIAKLCLMEYMTLNRTQRVCTLVLGAWPQLALEDDGKENFLFWMAICTAKNHASCSIREKKH